MDRNTQVSMWALGLILIGAVLIAKNIRDYMRTHETFDFKSFIKAMFKSLVIGNTMVFGVLFFWLGISILIFKQ